MLLSKDQGKNWEVIHDKIKELTFAKYSDNAYFAQKDRIFAI